MLPSKERLKRRDFPIVTQPGAFSVYNSIGTLKLIKTKTVKYAVVTSSKQKKSAVERNKLRRRVYCILQEIAPPTPIFGVLYISKNAYNFSYEEIKNNIKNLFEKISQHS